MKRNDSEFSRMVEHLPILTEMIGKPRNRSGFLELQSMDSLRSPGDTEKTAAEAAAKLLCRAGLDSNYRTLLRDEIGSVTISHREEVALSCPFVARVEIDP